VLNVERFLLCLLVLSAVLGAGEEPASVRIGSLPDVIAAGEEFTVPVRYELKPGLTARLNAELKSTKHVVLQAQRKEVSGEGTFRATFTAPDRPQQILIAAWVGTDWRKSLSPIGHSLPIAVISPQRTARRRAMAKEHKAAARAFLEPLGPIPDDQYAIALLKDERLPGHDPKLADELAQMLREAGHEVTLINADLLVNRFAITPDRFDMLFLPACHTLPGEAGPVIKAYCKAGGDLAALGTPAFRNVLARVGDRWLSKEAWHDLLQEQPTKRILFDFDDTDLSQWTRHTNAKGSPITRELTPGKQGKALHVVIPRMTGWDGYTSPRLEKPFPDGHQLTCLWARGVGGVSPRRDEDPRDEDIPPTQKEKTQDANVPPTQELMLEWREADGSRWIATFAVGPQWRRVVLAPGDFEFWHSVEGRGFPGDRFRPENAVQCVIGVAHTHTGRRTGRYEFFVDQLGTAPAPAGLAAPEFLPPPILDNFSPSYKFFRLRHGNRLVAIPLVDSLPEKALVAFYVRERVVHAHHSRPVGSGWGKRRSWRWLPILESERWWGEVTRLPTGGVRCAEFAEQVAAPGALCLDFATRSARLGIGLDEVSLYESRSIRSSIAAVIAQVAHGVFFIEGGTEFFTYRDGEEVTFGGRVINISRQVRKDLCLEVFVKDTQVTDPATDDYAGRAHVRKGPFDLAPGETFTCESTRAIPRSPRVLYWASVQHGDEAQDIASHYFRFYRAPPEAKRRFVTARDGDFWLEGERWVPHGVNYMPATGIGVEDREYFEYWLEEEPYDPEFIQRDLWRIKDVGFNSVSIFIYHRSLGSRNLLDFLRRCDETGLKVNLSIRPGTPMDEGYWPKWKEIIETCRLWEFDVIWAYDIAWEPFFGTDGSWRKYDELWRDWLVEKHGSLEAAETAWGVQAPRVDGKLSSPTGQQLTTDGPHRTFVADYRHFADDLVERRYSKAVQRIKSIDPNHLVSFRMTLTGDPTFNWARKMPYDFPGVADAVDFLAPEGYGRIGDWERVRPGMFTVAYARMCAPEKPVFWAEAGVSAWDRQQMRATPEKLEFQASFYRDFYKMLLASHSNGVAWWWYPGGYRVNERSDFGIINPDGTDRPVTRVIRALGPKLATPRPRPEPDYWITVDRDADARGLPGIYERVKDEYWRAVEAGKTVGLRRKKR
jgi:hypothetical protein